MFPIYPTTPTERKSLLAAAVIGFWSTGGLLALAKLKFDVQVSGESALVVMIVGTFLGFFVRAGMLDLRKLLAAKHTSRP